MIDRCLTNDPDKRPTATELLALYPFTDPDGTPQSIKKKAPLKARSNSEMDDKKTCLSESGMLKQIRLPAKLSRLNEMLPEKKYSSGCNSTKNAS